MIVAAAICPSPPLLASELTGQADILPELRAASAAAVTRLLAAVPDVVAVVGPAETTGPWDPAGELSLASFAPALRRHSSQSDNSKARNAAPSAAGLSAAGPPSTAPLTAAPSAAGAPPAAPFLPLALGIGARLLDQAGYTGPRTFHGIGEDQPAVACLAMGRELASSAPRVALLAVGDGSARRSAAAPGYLDERAAPFDEAVERAVRDGDLPAIAALDPHLATDLLAAGRPAWQTLAGALSAAARLRTEVLYSDAPLGVAYLVATFIP
ncbi:MAG TPA: hypothetical protein VH021_15080 [Trebonia sp.]|nr:hypothetical protein [Trebonia sp.]